MEKRLQDFILSVQQLADVRNLDVFNPVVFQMEHPITALRYTVVGAKQDPSYMGTPINVTWVVLDPADPYYLSALKLKLTLDPATATTKPEVTAINAWWHVVRTYDEIFADPQYYVNVVGGVGPVGPTGPAGSAGPAGTVDLTAFLKLAMGQLGQLAGTLEIRGADTVAAAGASVYELWLTEPVIDAQGNITPTTRQVFGPIIVQAGAGNTLPSGTVIDLNGTLHAGSSNVDVPVQLTAEYPSWTRIVQQTKAVTISSKTVTGIAINGASSIYAGASSAYSVTATYSDNTTATVTPTGWAVDNTTAASISAAGTLAGANPLTQDTPVVLTATLGGLTATKNVTVKQLVGTVLTINGAAAIAGGTSSSYGAILTLNSGAAISVTPTWSMLDATHGQITAGGVLTADNTSNLLTVQASYTLPGTTVPVTATKGVNVTAVVAPVYPFYGVGPVLPLDWQAFITALPYRGPNGSVNAEVSFDAIGQTSYMYFAYPKSYGKAQFFDKLSQFFGGWGGAGNSGPGPSAASIAASLDEPFETTVVINGTSYPFYVYRSEYANLGVASSNQWTVSPAP
jgi:hypothetical protein